MPFGVSAGAASLIGAGVGAVGSIASGLIGSSNAGAAASAQVQAARTAAKGQQDQYWVNAQMLDPWRLSGISANYMLGNALNKGYANDGIPTEIANGFQQSPGYQWQLGQGLAAINNTSAARGGLDSGNTLKALQTYGSGLANQDYYNYLNTHLGQWNTFVGQLANASNSGQNAATQVGNYGANMAANTGNLITGAGQAQAAGIVGGSNALTGGLGQATNYLGAAAMNGGFNGLFSGSGPFSANTLNTNFGTQFGPGTFPSASNPNAIVPGYMPDNYTPISGYVAS